MVTMANKVSRNIGYVRGLATAAGIGAAMLSSYGVAGAETGSADSPSSSADASAGRASARSGSLQVARQSPSGRTSTRDTTVSRGSRSGLDNASPAPAAASASAGSPRVTRLKDFLSAAGAATRPAAQIPAALSSINLSGTKINASGANPLAATPAGTNLSALNLPALNLPALNLPALTPSTANPLGANLANAASAALGIAAPLDANSFPVLAYLGSADRVKPGAMVAAQLAPAASTVSLDKEITMLVLSTALQLALMTAIAAIPPTPNALSPMNQPLVVNGSQLVPNGPETVNSIYGRWTYLPGGPSMTQGEQQFDVVDASGQTTGSFDAIVSRARSFNYQSVLVTATDATDVGTGPGQVPPVGSLITNFKAGPVTVSYSAMPTPSGDVVSCVVSTPFGDFSIPTTFDGAKGIADHSVDNRPVDLGNGYSIAPADPAGETLTGISGILPLFTTVQGNQKFNVYDSSGEVVGSFDGVFTTTSDTVGTYTQAILVTSSDGPNVGTGVGQVPPAGSVYNVIYMGSDDNYFLYSSKPSQSGDVVSLVKGANGEIFDVGTTFIDASTPPLTPALAAPTGHTFVAASPLVPSGVNGLPPREVQIQGTQPFDVYDSAGNRLGSVDADVSQQWDLLGIYSEAILVTAVTDGATGTTSDAVPPVGSIFDFVYFGNSGFGTSHVGMPTDSGTVTSDSLLTPFGDIPIYTVPQAPTHRPAGIHLNPLTTV